MEKTLSFQSGQCTLEGRLVYGPNKGVVLCHPHPLYGGDMENNVVRAAASAFQQEGWATLRFNFRGVGQSEGRAGDGEEEVQDVEGALGVLSEELRIPPDKTVLVGYSFGAWVGLRALRGREPLFGWVAIAPPVGVWDFSGAEGVEGHKMILAGDRDSFCPMSSLRDFYEGLSEPKEHVVLPGADHFFWGHEGTLSEEIAKRLRKWKIG